MRNEMNFSRDLKDLGIELDQLQNQIVPFVKWELFSERYERIQEARELVREFKTQGTLRDKQIYSMEIDNLQHSIDVLSLQRTMYFVYNNYIVRKYVKNKIIGENKISIHDIKIKELINKIYTDNGDTIESLMESRAKLLENFNKSVAFFMNRHGKEELFCTIIRIQEEFENALLLLDRQQEEALKEVEEMDI